MSKRPLLTLTSLANEQSAIDLINLNKDQIVAGFNETLSRYNIAPNEMETSLDMNSNRILNLPVATTAGEPVRKAEFDAVVINGGDFNDILSYVGTVVDTYIADNVNQELANFVVGSITPQGRLTLTSSNPVMVTNYTGQSTIYYKPYNGCYVPIYDGTDVRVVWISTGLSNSIIDDTKSPAAVVADSNYDLFIWDDAGTIRLSRGPAWTSLVSRGTSAELTRLNLTGMYTNNTDITNGPLTYQGTYVGTIHTNSSATVDWQFGSSASGGGTAYFGVYNHYNKVNVSTRVSDSTSSWTYSTAATRYANNSVGNSVYMITGIQGDAVNVIYSVDALCKGGQPAMMALDNSVPPVYPLSDATDFYQNYVCAHYAYPYGWQRVTAVEQGIAAGMVVRGGARMGLNVSMRI